MPVPVSTGPLARRLGWEVRKSAPLPPKPPPDKRNLCERFCQLRMHFLEIKMMLAMQRARRGFVAGPLRVLAREIIRSVAEAHAISTNDLVCHSHSRALVLARHEAAYEIARLTRLSLVQIGKALGGRDHTTVMHAIVMHAQRNGLPLQRGLEPKVRK